MAAGLDGDLTQRPSGSFDGTAEGRILGTPAYMSPEQARGQAVDKRTDIWAFGCVLFEMLAGRRAFDGDTISDTFVSILEREPDWAALPAGDTRVHPHPARALPAKGSTQAAARHRRRADRARGWQQADRIDADPRLMPRRTRRPAFGSGSAGLSPPPSLWR